MDLFDDINEDKFREILNKNGRTLKASGDYDKKEVGDRVMIWDYSSVTHESGEILENDDYDMQVGNTDYFIVIAVGQRYEYKSYFKIYKQDLIVVHSKTNKKYRVSYLHVRLV